MNLISKLKNCHELNFEEAFNLQTDILDGKLATSEILEVFNNIDNRPFDKYKNSLKISENEFEGFVKASIEKTIKIKTNIETVDIVGTGGDKLNTFNISTASCLLAASFGLKIAKHGNRSASGIFGSADVLEALGLDLEKSPQEILKDLESQNFAFLYAKKYNPSFRFVAEARKLFGKKTYFNFLGPLLNPISPKYMLLGLSDFSMANLMGTQLIKSGLKKIWIVSSLSGMDEISALENTKVKEFKKLSTSNLNLQLKKTNKEFEVSEFEINPRNFGLKLGKIQDIQIQNAKEAILVFKDVLNNKANQTQKNSVLLNVAAVLTITGFVKNFREGLKISEDKLNQGLDFSGF
jgi:anthranilate phosphoribosyltransferase